MTSEYRQRAIELGGRVLDLPDMYYPKQLPEIYRNIMPDLKEMTRQGGLLILPVEKKLERAAYIFLSYLTGKVSQLGILTRFDSFGNNTVIQPPDPGNTFWILHNGLALVSFQIRLEEWLKPGRAAVVTTSLDNYSEAVFRFPSRINIFLGNYGSQYLQGFKDEFDHEINEDLEQACIIPEVREFFLRTCAVDQWGVSIPVDIMKHACADLDTDFEQLKIEAGNRKLVFETTGTSHAVTSKGPPWAEIFVRKSQFDHIYFYDKIFSEINLNNETHRHFALALFQAWLSQCSKRMSLGMTYFLSKSIISGYFKRFFYKIDDDFVSGIDVYEILDWVQIASDLSEFQTAARILDSAFPMFSSHPHFIHQRAHLRLLMAEKTAASDHILEAGQSLKEAIDDMPGNVYALQSKGLYEASFGTKNKAVAIFEQILSMQPENSHTLIALADLYLDMGDYEKASLNIQAAEQSDPVCPCCDHLKGRLAFYLGRWKEAEQVWKEMLKKYNNNIYALQSLGNMARKRGLWLEAVKWLDTAFDYAPENSAVLLDYCLVLSDVAMFTEQKGWKKSDPAISEAVIKSRIADFHKLTDFDSAYEFRLSAMTLLNISLDYDPLNLRLKIQKAIHLIRINDLDSSDAVLSRLEFSNPKNPHVPAARALWHEQQGQTAYALSSFRKAVGMDRKNPELSLKLARAIFAAGDEKEAAGILNDVSRYIEAKGKEIPAHVRMSVLVEYAGLARLISTELRMNSFQAIEKARTIDPENPWTRIYE